MAKVLWPRYRSRSKTAGEDQRIGDLSLLSSVELVENLGSKNGLGSIWMFQCQNESCPSHETNLPFPTMKKSRALAINCASVLGFRAIEWRSRDSLKGFKFSWSLANKQKMQCIPATSSVKIWPAAYHLSNAYCCCKMIPRW